MTQRKKWARNHPSKPCTGNLENHREKRYTVKRVFCSPKSGNSSTTAPWPHRPDDRLLPSRLGVLEDLDVSQDSLQHQSIPATDPAVRRELGAEALHHRKLRTRISLLPKSSSTRSRVCTETIPLALASIFIFGGDRTQFMTGWISGRLRR